MQEESYLILEWSLSKKLAFRFMFVYSFIYFLPFPLNAFELSTFPFSILEWFVTKYDSLWKLIIPWVGKHLLNLDITIFPNGSGDTTFNYVQVLCFLFIAMFFTLIWTLLDRKRANYQYLHQWLRVYVRFSLASAMISYGAVKVIKSQFPYPILSKLIDNFGDSSPMGLLWAFMGFSEPYNVFTGSAEMLAGVLLAFPQLTTLGALVAIGVMSNVVMLNMSYDVPVKLFSFHLLMMSVFLLIPDLKRLAYFFVLNNKVEANVFTPLFETDRLNKIAKAVKVVFILLLISIHLSVAHEERKIYGDLSTKPPLYGIWFIEEFELKGEVKPPLLTDEIRWRRVVFDFPGYMLLENMIEKKEYVALKLDMEKKTIILSPYREDQDKNWRASFTFEQLDSDKMIWNGQLNGEPVRIKLQRLDEKKFLLNSRGFHWINEYPLNR
ncbi:MAG: hypothetical protein HY819_20485 [Acidobacteria bacterium]|nr:hypothetical protein [Acidobacteriota bacterium]